MKKLILLFAIVMTATTTALISCTDEYEEANSLDTVEQGLYAKYEECSEKPVVSILDLALGKASISRSGDCILGFTEEDVTYLNTLDEKGLRDLKSQLMNKWGIVSDEDVENILDQAYDEICENMTDEELVKFNNFINEYIEMPAGIELSNLVYLIQI